MIFLTTCTHLEYPAPVPEISYQDRAAFYKVFNNIHNHLHDNTTKSDEGFVESGILNPQYITEDNSSDRESIIVLEDIEENQDMQSSVQRTQPI